MQVQTTSTSTTITVSAPDQVDVNDPVIYAYNGNSNYMLATTYNSSAIYYTRSGTSPSYTYTKATVANESAFNNGTFYISCGYTDSITAGTSLAGNFTQVGNANTHLLNASGLAPGHKMTFCLIVEKVGTKNISGATLSLKGMTQNNVATRYIIDKLGDESGTKTTIAAAKTGNVINVGEALSFSGSVATTAAYVAETDSAFSYVYGANYAYGTYAGHDIVTNSSVNATTIYIFYTIGFSNASTTYYKEYNFTVTSGSEGYFSPLYDAPTGSPEPARYFYKTGGDSSSCYEGLAFNVTNLDVTVF